MKIENGVLKSINKTKDIKKGCFIVPDGVTEIEEDVFYDCKVLKSITITKSVTCVKPFAFSHCCNLADIIVEKDNKVYHSENNCLIETSTNTLVIGCKNSIIPNYITSIKCHAFHGCSELEKIIIPHSVTSIGTGAFSDCYSLKSLIIGWGLTSIADYAFYNCLSLEDFNIPDNITSIGMDSFSGCRSLTSIWIPESVTSIGNRAFEECRCLLFIAIPKNGIKLGHDVFPTWSNLESPCIYQY